MKFQNDYECIKKTELKVENASNKPTENASVSEKIAIIKEKDDSMNSKAQEHIIDEMVICHKMDKSPLSSFNNPFLEVVNTNLIKGSIFSSYIVYVIKCTDLGSEVKRRYKDFEWLKEELKKAFPAMFVSLYMLY